MVAGQFYPASEAECREAVELCLGAASRGDAGVTGECIGGIVPHAGWICSGMVAAKVLAALAGGPGVETFVIFGAAHRRRAERAAVYAEGAWATPLGEIGIDEPLAAAVLAGGGNLAEDDPAAHASEHSIEVQVPLIQFLAPQAKLLPIIVPPMASAPQLGQRVAVEARGLSRRAVFVGSTDLTHYGPRYGYTPQGIGAKALAWAKDVNDRRLIDTVLSLKVDEVLPVARRHQNACGPGAVAAAMAAAMAAGANRATLLQHTNSYETLHEAWGEMDDAVGYAGIVFH